MTWKLNDHLWKLFLKVFFNYSNFQALVYLTKNIKKEHLIKNLQTHQNYTNQLNNHFDSEVKRIQEETEEKIKKLKNPKSIEQAQIEENERIEILKIELNKQIQLITKHYDK